MKDEHDNMSMKQWKNIPLNKIHLKEIKHDVVIVKIYEVYGKQHCILEFNGSFFIQSNGGNIHTVLEKILNEQQ